MNSRPAADVFIPSFIFSPLLNYVNDEMKNAGHKHYILSMKSHKEKKSDYRHGIYVGSKDKKKIKKSDLLRRIEALESKLASVPCANDDASQTCVSGGNI